MKEYISKKICEVLGMEIEVKVEIPPKDDMGDFSVQCASLRNEQYKNPMEIASLIIEKFNDSDKNFKEIKLKNYKIITLLLKIFTCTNS